MQCSESTFILFNMTSMNLRDWNPTLAADQCITENRVFLIPTRLCVSKPNQ
jgi:hypothetical protein